MSTWTKQEWGNHIADLGANGEDPSKGTDIIVNHHIQIEASIVAQECIETHYWGNAAGLPLLTDSILEAQYCRHSNLMYERDSDRRAAGEDNLYFGSPLAYTAKVWKLGSHRVRKCASACRIYLDEGMHGRNISKTAKTQEQADILGLCPLCKQPDSQRHWLIECRYSGSVNIRDRTSAELQETIDKMHVEAQARTP